MTAPLDLRAIRVTAQGLERTLASPDLDPRVLSMLVRPHIEDILALCDVVEQLVKALGEIKECMGGDGGTGWESPEDVWRIAHDALSLVRLPQKGE